MVELPQNTSATISDYLAWVHETRRSYDRLSAFYDLLSNYYEKQSRERGLAVLQALPGERVMVIGCGTGHSLVYMAGKNARREKLFGLELSRGMILQSRKHLRSEGLDRQADLIQGDAHDLPLRDASMDGLFMAFILELFPPNIVARILSECLRILAPGGRLVVVSLSKAQGEGGWVGVYEFMHRMFPHLVDCKPIYVRKLLD